MAKYVEGLEQKNQEMQRLPGETVLEKLIIKKEAVQFYLFLTILALSLKVLSSWYQKKYFKSLLYTLVFCVAMPCELEHFYFGKEVF